MNIVRKERGFVIGREYRSTGGEWAKGRDGREPRRGAAFPN